MPSSPLTEDPLLRQSALPNRPLQRTNESVASLPLPFAAERQYRQPDAVTSGRTREDWLHGNALLVGKALMEAIPPAEQVSRVVQVLDLCQHSYDPIPQVLHACTIGRDSALWPLGREAFNSLRALSLAEEKRRSNPRLSALLNVAEMTAKTIYNATDPPAPFDRPSAWRLVAFARDFVLLTADDRLTDAVWFALCGADRARRS